MPVYVPLDRITDSPFQPRRHYDQDSIESLAKSILRDGLDSPPKARLVYGGEPAAKSHSLYSVRSGDASSWFDPEQSGDNVAQLAYGHRRRLAMAMAWTIAAETGGAGFPGAEAFPGLAGLPPGTMPLELRPLSDEVMLRKAVTENRQREDLSGVEEAESMHTAKAQFGYTDETIGELWGYTRSTVTNKLRLLKLPADVRELNVVGLLPERTARALVRMYDLSDDLAPFAEAARFDLHPFAGAEIRGFIEDGHAHEQITARVDEFVREVERAAMIAKREREPEMFDQDAEAEDAAGHREATHREEVDPLPPEPARLGAEAEEVEPWYADLAVWQNPSTIPKRGVHMSDAEAHLAIWDALTDEARAVLQQATSYTHDTTRWADHDPAHERTIRSLIAEGALCHGGKGPCLTSFGNHLKRHAEERERREARAAEPDVPARNNQAERDSASEPWPEFEAAVIAALSGVSPEARRVLLPALWPDGFRKGTTVGRWRKAGAWEKHALEMICDALIDDHTPQSAAEALGLAVDWPDVSADTSEPLPGADEASEEREHPGTGEEATPVEGDEVTGFDEPQYVTGHPATNAQGVMYHGRVGRSEASAPIETCRHASAGAALTTWIENRAGRTAETARRQLESGELLMWEVTPEGLRRLSAEEALALADFSEADVATSEADPVDGWEGPTIDTPRFGGKGPVTRPVEGTFVRFGEAWAVARHGAEKALHVHHYATGVRAGGEARGSVGGARELFLRKAEDMGVDALRSSIAAFEALNEVPADLAAEAETQLVEAAPETVSEPVAA